ncbi:membrane protein [Comamonadaceae bacterium]|nr:membrane protein [Comamonadaceae bacterium]
MARALTMAWLVLMAGAALAHKSSDSYLMVQVQADQVNVQWDIALRDIQFAIGLDSNGDDQITWGELQQKERELQAWAVSRLSLQRGGNCTLGQASLQVDEHTDGGYAVLAWSGRCPQQHGPLSIQYSLLFDLDAQHRGLLKLDLDGATHSAVLGPQSGVMQFAEATTVGAQFVQYLWQGVWHIWIGFDHILFLLALLLPAVLMPRRRDGHGDGVHGVSRFKDASLSVLAVVTAFTLAHSITLSLAALEIISLPSRLVESAIAGSVVFAAANNLVPMVQGRWLMAFFFGLIHGFGFASVLTELGLPTGALAVSLVGFNLGVEFGQLAIVAVFLPLAFVLRHTPFYQRGVLMGGSLAALLVALAWFVERAFNVSVFWWT